MLEAEIVEPKESTEEDLMTQFNIPDFKIENKENLGLYFDMIVKGSPQLRFSVTNKNGKELYANLISVEH